MDVFREFWNGTWTEYVPADPTVRWASQYFGETFRIGFVIVAAMLIAIPYLIFLDRKRKRDLARDEEAYHVVD